MEEYSNQRALKIMKYKNASLLLNYANTLFIYRTYIKLTLLFFISQSLWNVTSAQTNNQKSTVRVAINAIDGLQYDLVRFKVKPGAKVKIILTNKSKEEHNLIVTASGARQSIVNAALRLGIKGKAMNYIPEKKEVLWTIPLLSPGEKDSVTFVAPIQPGVYPYVCTMPGHGSVMYGALYVQSGGNMPEIGSDPNIPPVRTKTDSQGMKMHH
jgi:azurin